MALSITFRSFTLPGGPATSTGPATTASDFATSPTTDPNTSPTTTPTTSPTSTTTPDTTNSTTNSDSTSSITLSDTSSSSSAPNSTSATSTSSITTSRTGIVTSAVVEPSALQKQSSLTRGAIVGISIAGLAAIVLLVAVVFIMRRRLRRKNVDDTVRGETPRYSRETPGHLVKLPNTNTTLVWNNQMPVSAVTEPKADDAAAAGDCLRDGPASSSIEPLPRSEKRRALDRIVELRTAAIVRPDSLSLIMTDLEDQTNPEGRTSGPIVSAEMHHILQQTESLRTQAAPDSLQMAELREHLEALAPPEEVLRALQDIFQRRNEGIGDLPEYNEGNIRR